MAKETYYRSLPARMPDGSTRKVRVLAYRYNGSLAADSAFTVPAFVYVRRKYVKGFIQSADGMAWIQDREPGIEFCPMDSRKGLLP